MFEQLIKFKTVPRREYFTINCCARMPHVLTYKLADLYFIDSTIKCFEGESFKVAITAPNRD